MSPSPILCRVDAIALPADRDQVTARDAAGLWVDLDQLDRLLAARALETLRFAGGLHRSFLAPVPEERTLTHYVMMQGKVYRYAAGIA